MLVRKMIQAIHVSGPEKQQLYGIFTPDWTIPGYVLFQSDGIHPLMPFPFANETIHLFLIQRCRKFHQQLELPLTKKVFRQVTVTFDDQILNQFIQGSRRSRDTTRPARREATVTLTFDHHVYTVNSQNIRKHNSQS